MAAPIEEAFGKAKIAVFETEIEAPANESPELRKKLLAKGKLPDGETLRKQLSPELYAKLSDYLKDRGLSAETVGNLKPGLVALTLTYFEAQRLGLDPELGVERHFHQRARNDRKEIIVLETAEHRMDIITGLSKQEGEMFLDGTLKDLATLKEKTDQTVKAWQAGDTKTVAALVTDAMVHHPQLYRRFVAERNRRWFPKIEELLRGDKDAIVVVGTAHLAGKQSLIEMLEKNGFKALQQ